MIVYNVGGWNIAQARKGDTVMALPETVRPASRSAPIEMSDELEEGIRRIDAKIQDLKERKQIYLEDKKYWRDTKDIEESEREQALEVVEATISGLDLKIANLKKERGKVQCELATRRTAATH